MSKKLAKFDDGTNDNSTKSKALDVHLYYGMILKEQGYTWPEVMERLNKLLEVEGREPYTVQDNLVKRIRQFLTKHGHSFMKDIQPYLFSTDKVEILRYLISDLLIQYHEAKIDRNRKQVVSLGTKIQEAVWKLHQMEKGEIEDTPDAFDALVKKIVSDRKSDEKAN